MRNVTKKFVKEWSDKWLDYLYNANFPIESLIVNIIPNENEFATNLQVNYNDETIEVSQNLVDKIEWLVITSIWEDLAFWCFSINHHFNNDYKTYYQDLTFIDIVINISEDEVSVNIALDNTKFYKNETEKSDWYTNYFKCDKVAAIIINKILQNEKENK